jgi:hypothetical protein
MLLVLKFFKFSGVILNRRSLLPNIGTHQGIKLGEISICLQSSETFCFDDEPVLLTSLLKYLISFFVAAVGLWAAPSYNWHSGCNGVIWKTGPPGRFVGGSDGEH